MIGLPVEAYDYLPPHGQPGFSVAPPVGRRVLVPWQNGARVGIVAAETPAASTGSLNLREVIAVLDDAPLLTFDGLETLRAVAARTLAPAGIVLTDLFPLTLEPPIRHRVRLVAGADPTRLPPGVMGLEDWVDAAAVNPSILDFLRQLGLLNEEAHIIPARREVLRPTDGSFSLTPKQAGALDELRRAGFTVSAADLARRANVSAAVVTALVKVGAATWSLEAIPPRLANLPAPDPPPVVGGPLPAPAVVDGEAGPLPADVHQALRQLRAPVARLHGGRPAEREQWLARVLAEEPGGVLYLAPDRAGARRAHRVLGGLAPSTLIDGQLSAREREAAWAEIAAGRVRLVFATLTGLLAPIPDLGLVIVEDEGSDAYKLRGGSRVFLPDAARARAEAAGARLLLVGVTPAVESLTWPGVTLAPPRARVHVVDYLAREETALQNSLPGVPARRENWPLSGDLRHAVRQVAERGRQGVLIAPRRGYSAVLRCQECGWTPYCPNCDVPLRLHQAQRVMECHQCGYHHSLPESCPKCASREFVARGPGTEWIEGELKRFLPGFPVHRFDRDHRDDLAGFMNGEPGIVVATTAILGLEAPPNLALIALSFADTFVNHPDFRAAERYHSLLRNLVQWHPTRAPLIVIQTFAGGHPVLASLERNEPVCAYPRQELAARRRLGYPPFSSMALVQVTARSLTDAERGANDTVAILRDRVSRDPDALGDEPLAVLGPAPSPIPRQKGLYAYHILVRAPSDTSLGYRLFPLRQSRLGRVRVDVNPREFTDLVEENAPQQA